VDHRRLAARRGGGPRGGPAHRARLARPRAHRRRRARLLAATLAEAVELVLRHRDDAIVAAAAPLARTRRSRTLGKRLRRDRDSERLRRSLTELTEEVRALRLRRSETGAVRVAAMGVQLVAILVAAVAFLNLADFESFMRWAAGAALLQLVTATILLFDRS